MRRWSVPVAVLACGATLVLAAWATSAAPPTPSAAAPAGAVRVLQLNLCAGGSAGCYTGRATDEAAAVIRADPPDLVTLNEVCRDDVATLERALAAAVPGAAVTAAFQPARDRRTGAAYRCRDGAEYGIGLLSRWPTVPGSAVGGVHAAQDRADPEERVWACRVVAAPAPLTLCTTHLAAARRDVALAQCRRLVGTVVADLRARHGAAPLVLGADLNLGAGADLASCLPPGAARADDGGPQHVVASPELAVADVRTIDLGGSTDHPGLLVTLAPRAARVSGRRGPAPSGRTRGPRPARRARAGTTRRPRGRAA